MEHIKEKLENLICFCGEHINSNVLLKNGDSLALLIALKKHQKMQEHFSPVDAFIYVLEGEIEFKFSENNEVIEIKKEEIFFFKANEKHNVTAKKDSKMLVIRI